MSLFDAGEDWDGVGGDREYQTRRARQDQADRDRWFTKVRGLGADRDRTDELTSDMRALSLQEAFFGGASSWTHERLAAGEVESHKDDEGWGW